MKKWIEVTGKTVEDAVTEALIQLSTTSDRVEYEVLEKESSGFLGLNKKPARIRVALKETIQDKAENFLSAVFEQMELFPELQVEYDEEEKTMSIDIKGDDMGVLIGKRGQTLDSLQYLVSLVVNKESEDYIKVKLDTENYRERRKETLENLAKNISLKVRKTGRSVTLEPMNPYERRIIHSALQNDRYVETHSEGDEPYRKVVVTLKKGVKPYNSGRSYGKGGYGKGGYGKGGYGKGGYGKGSYNRTHYRKQQYQYGNLEETEETEQIEGTPAKEQTEE